MAQNTNKGKKEEPSNAPEPNRWYNISLGPSFKEHRPSQKFCTLRYEFKPASIDKTQPGTLCKNKDNRVTVEFHNNQSGKPKVKFEGSSEDYKENDAVLFFDGESFRLERLHRAVKRLRHVRKPGESASAAAANATSSVGMAVETHSSPVGKGAKFQSFNKNVVTPIPVEVEKIDVGVSENIVPKPKNEAAMDHPSTQLNKSTASPDSKDFDMEEHLDIINDDCDPPPPPPPPSGKGTHTGIDINIPMLDTDEEIADVDVSDNEADRGRNAAEALRAQVNAEERGGERSSSSSGSSGSESSGSGSESGTGSGTSSSESESSDDDSVNSI